MIRTVKLKDANGVTFYIEIEIVNGKFSMSGTYPGGCGQCYDSIVPANDKQKKLVEMWKTYHLNDMNAGTIEQELLLKSKECQQFKDSFKQLLPEANKMKELSECYDVMQFAKLLGVLKG